MRNIRLFSSFPRSRGRGTSVMLLVIVVVLVVALGGCGASPYSPASASPTATPTQSATSTPTAIASPTTAIGAATTATAPEPTGTAPDISAEEGAIRVPLQVLQAPDGSTLALVPVTINGQGPYSFALDTGASKSLVDATLSDQLGLPVVGSAGQVTGVAGAANANLVHISNWQLGTVTLPPSDAIKLSLSNPAGSPGLMGLIGSDILSTYNSIQVDYQNQVLILSPK